MLFYNKDFDEKDTGKNRERPVLIWNQDVDENDTGKILRASCAYLESRF